MISFLLGVFLRFIFIFGIIFFIFSKFFKRRSDNISKRQNFSSVPPTGPETLASCPVCGTYFHAAQGFYKNRELVCSTACRDK